MNSNTDRFIKDIDRLCHEGAMLINSMRLEIVGEDKYKIHLLKYFDEGKAEEYIKNLPDFNKTYERWYSESLSLLKQILPDRVKNFIELYEKPKNRKSVEFGNYVIQDYLQGLNVTFGGNPKVGPSAAFPQFEQQVAIISAAKSRFESSLYEIRQIIQADLFDSELAAARELHKNKFNRASGAMAGVLLEKHLAEVCRNHNVTIMKKNPTISDLNELLKSNSIIDIPQWRHISLLGDIRNLCTHNKNSEPTTDQVKDLIDGTDRAMRTIH